MAFLPGFKGHFENLFNLSKGFLAIRPACFMLFFCTALLLAASLPGYCKSSVDTAPVFDIPADTQNATGYLQVKWRPYQAGYPQDALSYELQRSGSPGFEDAVAVYTGPDLATFVSGLPEGTHHFRVRAILAGGQPLSRWSDPVRVRVVYQSAALTWGLLVTGAVVFLSTTAVVAYGTLQAENPDLTEG